jgi:hypothetical protein
LRLRGFAVSPPEGTELAEVDAQRTDFWGAKQRLSWNCPREIHRRLPDRPKIT